MVQIKKLLFGVLLSAFLTVLLFALLAGIAVQLGLFSAAVSGTLTSAAGGIAVFVAAFVTARLAGEKGLVHGAILASVYAFAFVAVVLLLSSQVIPAALAVRAAIFLLCGALAGILGVSKKQKVRF